MKLLSKSDSLSFQLFEKTNRQMVEKPFQIESGYTPRLWLILDGTTNAGVKREYFLYINELKESQNAITADVESESIILKNGESEILHYRKEILYPPPGVDTMYKRNGFIHPFYYTIRKCSDQG